MVPVNLSREHLLGGGNKLLKEIIKDGWVYEQTTGAEADLALVDETGSVQ